MSIGWSKPSRISLVYNERAPSMWRIISGMYEDDFKDARVFDLGCGYGDLALSALEAGAEKVIVADKEWRMVQLAMQKCISYRDKVIGWQMDLNAPDVVMWAAKNNDIGIMTSVLPYLDDPVSILNQAKSFPLFFLECQYHGDGPGPESIKDNADMADLLNKVGFDEILHIGHTKVEGRNTKRAIWACGHHGRVRKK